LDADDRETVAGVLEVDWWESGAADFGIVVGAAGGEIGFDVCEEEVVGFWGLEGAGLGVFAEAFGFEALGVAAGDC
jgi:hypothetical protein